MFGIFMQTLIFLKYLSSNENRNLSAICSKIDEKMDL